MSAAGSLFCIKLACLSLKARLTGSCYPHHASKKAVHPCREDNISYLTQQAQHGYAHL